MRSATEILGAETISAIRRPIAQARGLPGVAYTSEEFFDLERRELFPKSWMSVCFVEDVAEPGDAFPVMAAGVPIVVLRAENGEIRAFHNVCRHRATIVVQEPAKRLRHLQCPYHAWTYGLDGSLKAIPYFDGTPDAAGSGIDRDQYGLAPVRCGVWNHIVFVNLDADAPPLEHIVQPAAAELAPLDMDDLRLGHRLTWEFDANWKLVFDNWEVYHHVWVHEGVFDRMSDEVDLRTGRPYTDSIADGDVMLLHVRPESPRFADPGMPAELPSIPRRNDARPFLAAAVAVLANTTATTTLQSYQPVIYTPLSPSRTRATMAWYYASEALDPKYDELRERSLDRWLGPTRKFEDRGGIRSQDFVCMQLQQEARGSAVADEVLFSPTWEANVQGFQKWVIGRLESGAGRSRNANR